MVVVIKDDVNLEIWLQVGLLPVLCLGNKPTCDYQDVSLCHGSAKKHDPGKYKRENFTFERYTLFICIPQSAEPSH